MSENTPSTGSTSANPGSATLGAWEPIIEWIKNKADSLPVKKHKTVLFGTLAGIVVFTLLFTFVAVPRFVHAIFGIPLGLLLFACIIGGAHLYYKKHPEKTPLREKYPPMQRVKASLAAYVVLGIILVVISSRVTVILGGIIAVAAALTIYEFMRRSPEEIQLNESGALDPRDAELLRRKQAEDKKTEDEEIMKILADLPEEKRALLANANLSDAMVVQKKKKRGFLKKGN